MEKGLGRYPSALTVKDVTEILGVCEKTVYNLIQTQTLHGIRIGQRYYISKDDLKEYKKRRNENGKNKIISQYSGEE